MPIEVYSRRSIRGSGRLFFQTKLLHERAVCALVVDLKVLQMLAAVGHKAQKSAARVLVFVVFVQMGRQFLDTARQKSHLYLRGTRIGIVAAPFCNLILLLSLRKHGKILSYSAIFCKPRPKRGLYCSRMRTSPAPRG